MTRELTTQESCAAMYVCVARNHASNSKYVSCPTCRADVVRLVDAPPVPTVSAEDVTGIRSRVEDYAGLADQYEQLSCPEGAKQMRLKAESMARILAAVEYVRALQPTHPTGPETENG